MAHWVFMPIWYDLCHLKMKKKAYANEKIFIFLQGFKCLFTNMTPREDRLYVLFYVKRLGKIYDNVDSVLGFDYFLDIMCQKAGQIFKWLKQFKVTNIPCKSFQSNCAIVNHRR